MLNNISSVLKRHWDKILLATGIITYIIVLTSLSIARHDAFASRYDLSNMDQTLYYTLQGHFFQLRFPDELVSRFSIHADIILALLAPIYLIWDNVRMLLIVQSIFLALGAIPVYLLTRSVTKSKVVAVAMSAVYLLNPGMQLTNIYDFHGIALAIPFLLFAFYFAYIKSWKWYWIFIFLSLLTKENVSLTVVILGILLFFIFRERKIGIVSIIIGLLWFIAMVVIVMPHFTLAGNLWALEGLGEAGNDSLLTIFRKNLNPISFAETFLISKETLDYYILLLRQFAFLPIIGIPWFILALPEIVINVLRGTTSIVFHYDSGVIPGMVIATIFALSYVKRLFLRFKITKKYAQAGLYLATAMLFLYALRVNYHYSPLPTTPSCSCYIYNVTPEDREFEKALQAIPRDASITASLEIRPHVSHREFAFNLPSATQSAEYIALITQNRMVSNYNPKEYENVLIPQLMDSIKHKLIFKSEHFYLFERTSEKSEIHNSGGI